VARRLASAKWAAGPALARRCATLLGLRLNEGLGRTWMSGRLVKTKHNTFRVFAWTKSSKARLFRTDCSRFAPELSNSRSRRLDVIDSEVNNDSRIWVIWVQSSVTCRGGKDTVSFTHVVKVPLKERREETRRLLTRGRADLDMRDATLHLKLRRLVGAVDWSLLSLTEAISSEDGWARESLSVRPNV
jgi:hypothetical protein